MKKIALIALLVATPALAQDLTVEKLDAAKSAIVEKEAATAASIVAAEDVSVISVRVDVKAAEGERVEVQTDVVILPSDPEFATILEAAKAAYARRAAKADEALTATGVEAKPVEADPVVLTK